MLAISRFRVANGLEKDVKQAFESRPRLVEHAPGFQGMNVFTDLEDPSIFLLVTRWSDYESYRAWHSSEAHNLSHSGIPPGLKLDAAHTQLTFCEEFSPSREMSGTGEWSALLREYVSTSAVVHFIAASSDGVIRECNPQMADLLGVPEPSLRGQPLWHYLTEPDAARLQHRIAAPAAPARRELPIDVMLNFVSTDNCPHTLECKVYLQDRAFAVIGNPPFHHEVALQKELSEVNHELLVQMREHARQGKELKAAKAQLEQTLSELNTLYWHLRKAGEVLPICMKCGKVESADARWESLVDFMKARFPFLSHGYCPQCASALLAFDENLGPSL